MRPFPPWRRATSPGDHPLPGPDFVYGRSSSFSEKNNTTHDTLSGYGIMSLSSIEGYTVGADVDVVYQDFYNLGRIFQVEDRAEEIVSAMKEQIAAVEEAVAGAEPVKVFVYDMAQGGAPTPAGDNFTAKLISTPGGVNILRTWTPPGPPSVGKRLWSAPRKSSSSTTTATPLWMRRSRAEGKSCSGGRACHSGRPHHLGDPVRVLRLLHDGDTIEKFARSFHPDCFQ